MNTAVPALGSRAHDRSPGETRGGAERISPGVAISIRRARPADRPLFAEFERAVSPRSRYQRFFSMRAFAPSEVDGFFATDDDRCVALLATATIAGVEREIAVARYVLSADGRRADIGLLVADAWQSRSLGKQLLAELIVLARQAGIGELVGMVLSTNYRMLGLVRRFGFVASRDPDDATVTIVSMALV